MSLFMRILLPSTRVNLTTSQRLCRQFTSCVSRLNNYYPRPRFGQRQQPSCNPGNQHDQYGYYPPPPPRIEPGKLVLGSIVAGCLGISAYNYYLRINVQNSFSFKQASKLLQNFQKHFVLSWQKIQDGKYYTILSSTFLHTSAMHLGFDMLAFWTIGRSIVMLYGIPSFMVLYVGSALAAGVAEYCWWDYKGDRYGSIIGNSGAISGLFSAITCIAPGSWMIYSFVPVKMYIGFALGVTLSVAGMGGYLGPYDLGHASHLGGAAFGVLWFVATRGRFRRRWT